MPTKKTNRIGSGHYTDSAPNYPLFSRPTLVSIGVAAGLIAATLALTWVARDTVLAELTLYLYRDAPYAPFTGVLAFGVVLTGGRYAGLAAAADERIGLAFVASAVVAVAYAAFTAGVLSLYSVAVQGPAVLVTAGLTTLVTLGAAALVYTTDHSFAHWDTYSGIVMLVGAGATFVVSLVEVTVLMQAAFGLFLLGWVVDLVFEVYMVSEAGRSPVVNGIGVYVAFMGVFVHLLQLVLEAMADD